MSDAAETTPPEEPKMEIHKPHAAKTWKEFFIELGTVVLGILIALSLEQAVENWREHRQSLEAHEAMRAELAGNLASISQRAAISACARTRVTEITALLDKAENHQPFAPPGWIGEASSARLRYIAEPESGRSSLFSPGEQRQFSSVYSFFHSIDAEQERERQAWVKLQPLEGRSSVPPEMIANLRQALAEARYEDERILFLLDFAKSYAVPLDLPQMKIAADFWPQAWPLCLPTNMPRAEALRRSAYRNTGRISIISSNGTQ